MSLRSHPALRGLIRDPGFAAAAVFILAMGIGANTAIFTVANSLLLKPLPYAHPESLLVITGMRADGDSQPLSWPRVRMIRERARSFTGIAAFTREVFNLTGSGDPEQVRAARVSWNFFDVLGVRPEAGRSFLPAEDRAGADGVVIVSRPFLAGHPGMALGRRLFLDGRDYTVIGVLPRDFQFPRLAPVVDLYALRVFELNVVTPEQVEGGVGFLDAVGRLQPSATPAAAQTELDAISAQFRAAYPKLPDAAPTISARASDLRDATVANVRPTLLILFGSVVLVLVVACANVSSLLLSRALGRRREIAVQLAIGAGRGAIIRQLLAESLLLALLGGTVGAALCAWGTPALAAAAADYLPRASEIRLDPAVLAFTLVISALAGIAFGLVPALQLTDPDVSGVLRAEGRGAAGGHGRHRLRGLLVIAQVALSLVLVAGAGLLLRNFIQLRAASPGFDPRGLLTMNISLPPARYSKGAQMIAFYDELLRQVRSLPGIQAAAISSALPVHPVRFSPALPEGQPDVPLMQRPFFQIQTFTPGLAETMRIPLLRGRDFTAHDIGGAPTVAIVNQTVVRRFWPGQNPIGKRILLGRRPAPLEVAGVLGDIRNNKLAADVQPEIYLPFAQLPWADMNLVVRTAGDPHTFVGPVRSRVLAVDRDQPVTGVQTMDELLSGAADESRYAAALLGALAALALLLAVVGIYGAIAYGVAERTSELGIRMALGAARGDILTMVLRQGLTLALTGIAAGLAASLLLTRVLESLLYRVSARDPVSLAAAAVLFLVVAALASYLPARRATRVDPMTALRE